MVEARGKLALQNLVAARKAAAALRSKATSPATRLDLCRKLLGATGLPKDLTGFSALLSKCTVDERHYWIGTFYTLLLSVEQRRSQAAYFTPPHLSRNVLVALEAAGFDPNSHSVIDPAAGGAAFLSTVAAVMKDAGGPVNDIVRRLRGVEIDRGLAQLAEILIADRLERAVQQGAIVSTGDALTSSPRKKFDVVVANPPYGRVSLSDQPADYWEDVCHPGHINKYALFTKLCLSLAKPGGLVALVLPSSFIGGPLYDRLRQYIRSNAQVLTLGAVDDRDDVFVDVQQDVSVLIARVGEAHRIIKPVTFSACAGRGPFKGVAAANLPAKIGAPWTAPAHASGLPVGGATLADYDATVRSGYFVWNREQDRMLTKRSRKLDFPLIWAENIAAGKLCTPGAKRRSGLDYVRFESDSSAIIRTNALVLQRTTNNAQPRRLVAARVNPAVLKKYGGFVSENHTIVITAGSSQVLPTLARLLNSAAVDARYRRMSGTVAISVELLRQMDLPKPEALAAALRKHEDIEKAIETAYALSSAMTARAAA